MDILKPRERTSEEGGGARRASFHDDLYDQAVAIVCDDAPGVGLVHPAPAAHRLQPRRALVEQMEREGIVGPTNGAKPREVLAPSGEYLTAAGA